MYKVINTDGSQSSPADTTQLFRWARENRLFPHSILIDDEGKTMRADSLPGLQTAFPPPQPPPMAQQRQAPQQGRGSKVAKNFATVAVLFVAGTWMWNSIQSGIRDSRSESGTIYTTQDGTPVNSSSSVDSAPAVAAAQEPPASPEDQAVYQKIKARIAKDHPGDYSTQKFLFDENKEAYQYMKTASEAGIKGKIEEDHPYDFSTQKYLYDENVEAKQFMDAAADSEIKSKVQEDHPNDYSTQRYLYKENVEAKSSLGE